MTPEIRAAYEKLEAAINEVLRLRGYQITAAGLDMVLTDWIVCATQQSLVVDDDGAGTVSFVRLQPPRQPWHHTLGVLRGCILEMEHDFVNWDDNA